MQQITQMLRRSSLTVPLSSQRFIAKAHLRGADAITLDLEDGVAPDQKASARERLPEAVAMVGRAGADVGVRINRPIDLAVRDIEAAVIPGVAYLAVAKAESGEHIKLLCELIGSLEVARGLPEGAIRMTAAIETPTALTRAKEIAAADGRLFGLGLGSEDIAAACGMEPSEDALLLPKQLIVFAARAAGILPFGYVGTVANYGDLEGLRRAVVRAKALGFRGASAIHPDQVPILNAGFGPSQAELDHAKAVVEANARAVEEGRGAFSLNGKMIDRPVVVRAEQVLALAATIALREARMQAFGDSR